MSEALERDDVFAGVSGPDLVTEADVASIADDAIGLALANPQPEIAPLLARRHAAVVATGRSDEPNQINNVLAFPGFFRGLLDARATSVSDAMILAAVDALATCVAPEELRREHVIPSPFDPRVPARIAAAVASASKGKAAEDEAALRVGG